MNSGIDIPSKAENEVTLRAAAAVEAVVATGAALLVAEPWRASRIVRGAESMPLDALRAEVARRRALPPPADFNRALALAQLVRALDDEAFAAAWALTVGPPGSADQISSVSSCAALSAASASHPA